jgi:hypothetical protein
VPNLTLTSQATEGSMSISVGLLLLGFDGEHPALGAGDEQSVLGAGDEQSVLGASDEQSVLGAGDEQSVLGAVHGVSSAVYVTPGAAIFASLVRTGMVTIHLTLPTTTGTACAS